MKIVEAMVDHIDEVVPMFDAYRVFYRKPADIDGAREFIFERIEKKDSVIYIAMGGNNMAYGFAQMYPLFSSTRMSRMWLLNDLFVKPEHRGRGISKLLIERCKALAMQTEAAGIMLETEKKQLHRESPVSCNRVRT